MISHIRPSMTLNNQIYLQQTFAYCGSNQLCIKFTNPCLTKFHFSTINYNFCFHCCRLKSSHFRITFIMLTSIPYLPRYNLNDLTKRIPPQNVSRKICSQLTIDDEAWKHLSCCALRSHNFALKNKTQWNQIKLFLIFWTKIFWNREKVFERNNSLSYVVQTRM